VNNYSCSLADLLKGQKLQICRCIVYFDLEARTRSHCKSIRANYRTFYKRFNWSEYKFIRLALLSTSLETAFRSNRSVLFARTMDVEKLINRVFEERSLWELKSKHYHNQNSGRILWAQTGNDLNVSSK
jgi:hypothetical protein